MKVHTFKEFRQNMSKILREAKDASVQFSRLGVMYEVKKVRTNGDEVKRVKKSLKVLKMPKVGILPFDESEMKLNIAVAVPDVTVAETSDFSLKEGGVFVPVHQMRGLIEYGCGCAKVEGKALCPKHGVS